jgi:hypothetical protein
VTTASKELRRLKRSFAYGPAPSERDILWHSMRCMRLEAELMRLRAALLEIRDGDVDAKKIADRAIAVVRLG